MGPCVPNVLTTYIPVCNGEKIILVPKYTVRYQIGVDHTTYRRKFVLEFLKEEHLRADDSLVTTIRKKGNVVKKVVYLKTVDEFHPKDKDFLAEFSINHPDVINRYKDTLKEAASKIPSVNPEGFDEGSLANFLASELTKIPPGRDHANDYHNLIIGIISFVFFPNLIYPKKEAPINSGRKRIDIRYTNGKDSGFFYRMSLDKNITANIIPVECKNYSDDIGNEEFDQLIGRFDRESGRLGMLFYRSSTNDDLVIARSRDAAKAGQGVVLPVSDRSILNFLDQISRGNRFALDKIINDLYLNVIS